MHKYFQHLLLLFISNTMLLGHVLIAQDNNFVTNEYNSIKNDLRLVYRYYFTNSGAYNSPEVRKEAPQAAVRLATKGIALTGFLIIAGTGLSYFRWHRMRDYNFQEIEKRIRDAIPEVISVSYEHYSDLDMLIINVPKNFKDQNPEIFEFSATQEKIFGGTVKTHSMLSDEVRNSILKQPGFNFTTLRILKDGQPRYTGPIYQVPWVIRGLSKGTG